MKVLKEHESGLSIKDLACKCGVSKATIYNWKDKCGSLGATEFQRLRDLEREHARLQKLYAQVSLEKEALMDVLEKNLGLRRKEDDSLLAKRVIQVIDQLLTYRGKSNFTRVDSDTEFIAKDIRKWALKHEVEFTFIELEKPTQNGFIERLNETLRREVLDLRWFTDLEHVRDQLGLWMSEYNRFRPHKGLGYLSPDLFVQKMSL